MDAIRCEKLTKAFDGVHALEHVSTEIPPSGISAIIGPNGAGKTTLLNILTEFLKPDSGRCFLGGHEITYLAPQRIARLGISRTFQDLRLILQASVLDNVLLARPHQKGERLLGAVLGFGVNQEESQNREQAMRLLKFVDLDQKADDLAGELSYGQQKLLTLACCLATEATVLLLDEPVSGVHPQMASQILGLLRQLRAEGKVVLFIEHEISAVREIANHVIVMDEGKVIAEGAPGDVLERPEILEAYLA